MAGRDPGFALVDDVRWQCARKIAFASEEKARRAVHRAADRGTVLDHYRCPHCALWHLASPRRDGR